MSRITPYTLALSIALVAGCAQGPTATAPGTSPAGGSSSASAPGPKPNPATKAASTKANLAIEKLRLSELFKGTPVVIALLPDGSLRADVPLAFSFDPGKAIVKPPLAAVLDRVANGQLNEITHLVVSAPADPPPVKNPTLVGERASAVRDYLVGRGLAASRLAVAGGAGAIVRVVVSDAPAP